MKNLYNELFVEELIFLQHVSYKKSPDPKIEDEFFYNIKKRILFDSRFDTFSFDPLFFKLKDDLIPTKIKKSYEKYNKRDTR
jgi:hypothetical protein